MKATPSVWDCVELAFESDWESGDEGGEVPELLNDATGLMERGRRLLLEGLKVTSKDQAVNDDDAYRAAARNGKVIPDDVLAQMHRAREEVEAATYE